MVMIAIFMLILVDQHLQRLIGQGRRQEKGGRVMTHFLQFE